MSAKVPTFRSDIVFDRYVHGAPVSSSDLQPIQETMMWCYGRGAQLVPACRPRSGGTITAGTSQTFWFYVKPRYNATRWMWSVVMHGGVSGNANGTIATPTGSTKTFVALSDRNYSIPIQYVDSGITQSATSTPISITVSVTTGTAYVDSISCYEIPRAALDVGTTENGLEKNNFRSGEPVYSTATAGPEGMYERLNDGWGITQRGSHYHFTADGGTGGGSQDLTALTNVFSTTSLFTTTAIVSGTIPLLERRYFVPGSSGASTIASVEVRVLGQVSSGGAGTIAGNLDIAMTNGSTASVTWNNTGTCAWTSPVTFDVEVEDENYASALQGGAWDEATLSCYRTGSSATNLIYVAAISIATTLT